MFESAKKATNSLQLFWQIDKPCSDTQGKVDRPKSMKWLYLSSSIPRPLFKSTLPVDFDKKNFPMNLDKEMEKR